MTPLEFADRIATLQAEVSSWEADPRGWGRDDLNGAVEVWDRLDRLITDLIIVRRDHAVTLAHRIGNEQTATTRDGNVTLHRDVPRSERWDGHGLLGELAEQMITGDGEIIDAIPIDVLREVIPACGQGQTSSKWKVTELRKVIPKPEEFRSVDYGTALVSRGPIPRRLRNLKPPVVGDDPAGSSQEVGGQTVDEGV